jgi:hypothetical protein
MHECRKTTQKEQEITREIISINNKNIALATNTSFVNKSTKNFTKQNYNTLYQSDIKNTMQITTTKNHNHKNISKIKIYIQQ